MDKEKCTQCGTPAAPDAKFCESCGAPLAAASQPVAGPVITEPAPTFAAQGAEIQYQGVGIRFVALLIDVIILEIINYILTFLFGGSGVAYDASTGAVTIGAAYYAMAGLMLVIALLYFTLLLGIYGQSVGMMLVKIKVVKEADSSPISYGDALVRTILLVIDAIPYIVPLLLGAILIWTSDKKQRLGDRVAHTVVVKAQ